MGVLDRRLKRSHSLFIIILKTIRENKTIMSYETNIYHNYTSLFCIHNQGSHTKSRYGGTRLGCKSLSDYIPESAFNLFNLLPAVGSRLMYRQMRSQIVMCTCYSTNPGSCSTNLEYHSTFHSCSSTNL